MRVRSGTTPNLVPLLLRIGVGLTFFFAGLDKVLGGTAGLAGFFGSLGVPLPQLMAPFISYLELLGGLALLLGLLTRPIALLLAADMLVALLLVAIPSAMGTPSIALGWNNLRVEFLLLISCLTLALSGSGLISIDTFIQGQGRSRNNRALS
jgi:putative oxidoreductase